MGGTWAAAGQTLAPTLPAALPPPALRSLPHLLLWVPSSSGRAGRQAALDPEPWPESLGTGDGVARGRWPESGRGEPPLEKPLGSWVSARPGSPLPAGSLASRWHPLQRFSRWPGARRPSLPSPAPALQASKSWELSPRDALTSGTRDNQGWLNPAALHLLLLAKTFPQSWNPRTPQFCGLWKSGNRCLWTAGPS